MFEHQVAEMIVSDAYTILHCKGWAKHVQLRSKLIKANIPTNKNLFLERLSN